MEEWGWTKKTRYAATRGVGLGALAGALEAIGLAASLKLPLGVVDFAMVSLTCMLSMSMLALGFGFVSGWPVHVGWADKPAYKSIALHLGVIGGMLCAWYLWQGAYTLYGQEQPIGAAAMAAMPVGFVGVIYFNARFWVRRVEMDRAPALGWLPFSFGSALVLALGAALVYPQRDTGGSYALEGDQNVVIITVDGVRRDTLDFTEDGWTLWASGGVVFADAVSPTPAPAPAAATVLTGLHPLRHKVIFDGDGLRLGYRTLAEALEVEGWATGGFVSSQEVGSSRGFSQGFRIFDDSFSPWLPGVTRVNLVGHMATAFVGLSGPDALAGLRARSAADTVDRFGAWLAVHREVPLFGWVHLDGGDINQALVAIHEQLEAADVLDRTLVVIAGSHGEREPGRSALHDPAVRVPLVLHMPDVQVTVPVVQAQVRLMDVAATVLEFLRLDVLGETEGVDLIGYGQGLRKATVWCSLVVETEDGQAALGMRNNGIKYIRDPDGVEHVYDLRTDPTEEKDVAEVQASTVAQARALLSGEDVALEKILRSR